MFVTIIPSPWINAQVLLTLLLLLGVSALTFWALVRRWESHRQWLALAEWGREKGFRARALNPAHLPAPLQTLLDRRLMVRLCMSSERTLLIQMQTAPVGQPGGMPAPAGEAVWNVLVRRLETAWHPTGLRPAFAHGSFLDLFSLAGFPTLGNVERFMIFGTDSAAARALSESMTRSLLPPDIGMLLHGNHLLLDFSDRPFDEIEFNRVIAMAEQIAAKLPFPQ